MAVCGRLTGQAAEKCRREKQRETGEKQRRQESAVAGNFLDFSRVQHLFTKTL